MDNFSASPLATPTGMHADEHLARVDLAACYRLVALYGWSDLVIRRVGYSTARRIR